jgi:hypothetical protein
MKKLKIVFWSIILILVVIFVYQNRSFLFKNQEIVFNIVYGNPFKLVLPIAVYFLTFLFLGGLIGYFFSLSEKFKSRKNIRVLNETLESERKKAADLEARLSAIAVPQDYKSDSD